MRLKNKVALITGSSRGIGAATAKRFAEEGAYVSIHYKDQKESAEKIYEEIGTKKSILIQADLTKEEDIKRFVKKFVEKFKRIDILVNNAGAILHPGDWKTNRKTWQETFDINLTSAWLMTREVAPLMKKQGNGSIINVTSVYGFLGAAPVLAYTLAKGGMITMTKSFAKELAPEIRVNAVAPSNVKTDMTKGAGPDLIKFFREQTPLKRIAEPEEIAHAILFLSSDEASYITGEMLVIDGGYSLK